MAPEVRTPQTWQVPRAEFDELLLRHAAASGADVREGHRVLDVAFDGDGATVAFRDAADCPREVRVAAVVDASGRVGLLARKLDLRVDEPASTISASLPTTPVCRARTAGGPGTSASWRATIWAGSGSFPSPKR
jgi:flavin-dependent dehydrogenase